MKIIERNGTMVTIEADEGKYIDMGGGICKKVITPENAIDLLCEVDEDEAKRIRAIYAREVEDNER